MEDAWSWQVLLLTLRPGQPVPPDVAMGLRFCPQCWTGPSTPSCSPAPGPLACGSPRPGCEVILSQITQGKCIRGRNGERRPLGPLSFSEERQEFFCQEPCQEYPLIGLIGRKSVGNRGISWCVNPQGRAPPLVRPLSRHTGSPWQPEAPTGLSRAPDAYREVQACPRPQVGSSLGQLGAGRAWHSWGGGKGGLSVCTSSPSFANF